MRKAARRGADSGATKAATGGLQDELQASEKRMWYLCDVCTWRSHVPWSAKPGQGFRVVSQLDTIDALNGIVLTF